MNLEVLNRSGLRVPRAYLATWLKALAKRWRQKKVMSQAQTQRSLFVAFVTPAEMTELNSQFRRKKKPTDVLSFESDDPELLGELVICPEVIVAQAQEHGLTQKEEYAYMLTHGVLHLLGHEHEQGGEPERLMMALQDEAFEALRGRKL